MKFEEALLRFKKELIAEYGPSADNAITRISLDPKFFDTVMLQGAQKKPYEMFSSYCYKPSDMSKWVMFDVALDARTKEDLK